jgi:trigger factor
LLKSLEDISATKKRIKIEIPAETIEAEIQKELIDVRKKARIPGFRPGKAPMTLIEKNFGPSVEAEVLDRVVPKGYVEALQEAGVKPLSHPVVEEKPDFKRNAPLSMTVTVEVRPKIENLNYDNLTVTETAIEVKDEEVDNALNNVAGEKATYESSDKPAEIGDLVTIDYIVKEDAAASKNDVVLKIGSGPYPETFFNALTGKKKDDKCEVEAEFTSDSQSELAGKKLNFEITIKDVKKRNMPAIDDEFAKDLGFDDLSSLKERVQGNILSLKQREAESAKHKELLDKLIAEHDFEVPEGLVNQEIEEIASQIRAYGKQESSDDETLKAEIKPNAERKVKASILLELIGEKEGVNVTEEEVKTEVLNMSQRYYTSPENIIKFYMSKDGSLDGIKQAVLERKVLNILADKAKATKEN